jgi:hypothetical protein
MLRLAIDAEPPRNFGCAFGGKSCFANTVGANDGDLDQDYSQ